MVEDDRTFGLIGDDRPVPVASRPTTLADSCQSQKINRIISSCSHLSHHPIRTYPSLPSSSLCVSIIMSATSALMFEPLDLLDFQPIPSTSKATPPIPDEMDLDLDAELALFEEEERNAARKIVSDSPPPDMDEEPDWADDDVQMESIHSTQSLMVSTAQRQVVSTQTAEATSISFGSADLLGGPIASCEYGDQGLAD